VTRAWFLPAALADIEAAFRWYETERVGLGREFVGVVEAAIDQILEFPGACPLAHRDARRYLVERSPTACTTASKEMAWSSSRCCMPPGILRAGATGWAVDSS
jgi:plasmid stabilization system protein ParE